MWWIIGIAVGAFVVLAAAAGAAVVLLAEAEAIIEDESDDDPDSTPRIAISASRIAAWL